MKHEDYEEISFYSCLLPYTETYFSHIPEIVMKEGSYTVDEEENVSSAITDTPCICFMFYRMMHSSLKAKIVWSFRWLEHEIKKDMDEGKFLDLGSLLSDLETVYYVTESYLRLASNQLSCEEDAFVDCALNTEEGQKFVCETYSYFAGIYSFLSETAFIKDNT